jgi:Spy/CpxP family protein refolding chaperone
MKRVSYFVTGAVMAAMLATGASTYAQGPAFGRRGGGPGAPGGFGGPGAALPLRELNLSDAQQQQIHDIRDRHRDETQQIGERLRTAMEAQRKAVEATPVNESLIRSTTQELADVQADAAVAQAHARTEMLSVLTAEQRAQLSKLQTDREARAQQFRENPQQRRQQRGQQQQ